MAHKSPCKDRGNGEPCSLVNEDKNNDVCRNCVLRMAYVQGLGCLASNVPDNMTDYVTGSGNAIQIDRIEDEIDMEEHETKICKNDECSHGGAPQPIHRFQNHGPSGRRLNICKTCMSERMRAGILKSRPKPKKEQSRPTEKVKQDKMAGSAKKANKHMLVIDFSNHKKIYNDIVLMAASELRTPENQALYIFKRVHEEGLNALNIEKQLEFPQA